MAQFDNEAPPIEVPPQDQVGIQYLEHNMNNLVQEIHF